MVFKIISACTAIVLGMIAIRKYREYTWGFCKSKKSLKNKTAIITGANCGLGKAVALEFAKRGAHVILACRDLRKAQEAMIEIRSKSQNGILEIMHLDLSSFQSIQKFAENFLMSGNRLDILINNAGVFQCPFMTTKEGFEMQFGVNHLGHFLLTKLLLEKLKESSPSRVIIVSSELYKKGNIVLDIEHINSETYYNKSQAYKNSKLANILFARELARHVRGSGVSVFAISPGMVYTKLHRHLSIGWLKMAFLIPFGLFFVRTAYQGCQTILHCAVSEEVENESGCYYRNCKRFHVEGEALSDVMAVKLWNASESFIKEPIKREETKSKND